MSERRTISANGLKTGIVGNLERVGNKVSNVFDMVRAVGLLGLPFTTTVQGKDPKAKSTQSELSKFKSLPAEILAEGLEAALLPLIESGDPVKMKQAEEALARIKKGQQQKS